jgi:sec-independent protein translocase protein TatA
MGALAPSHLILLLLVIVLLFGTGRISNVMGDFAKGLKAFKKNMADESDVSMEAQSDRPIDRPSGSITGQAGAKPAPEPSHVSHS